MLCQIPHKLMGKQNRNEKSNIRKLAKRNYESEV